ncbi:hypothetical protein [Serinicoccus marinus]|uniref:hypothetical protein n=1 Tax=Serinicoccus marinus TaxID=247333 RepID=UPI002493A45B|nr:hypothetical protein [Serinicoccus marinus]
MGGLQTQGAWTRQQGRWSGVHLALDPLAARGLLGMPAAELAPGADGHTTVEADAVLPREVRALADRLARLTRFEHAAARVHGGGHRNLTDLAHATGHADLAHLDAEWRDLIGCSPTTWLAQERRNVHAEEETVGADSGP